MRVRSAFTSRNQVLACDESTVRPCTGVMQKVWCFFFDFAFSYCRGSVLAPPANNSLRYRFISVTRYSFSSTARSLIHQIAVIGRKIGPGNLPPGVSEHVCCQLTKSTMLSRSPSSVVLTIPTGLFRAISTKSSDSRLNQLTICFHSVAVY